jgi:peptidoglycan hydrolase CwlO-like protein
MLNACCPRYVLARARVAGFGLALCALAVLTVAEAAHAGPLQQKREKARALAAEIAELDAGIGAAVQRYSDATQELDDLRAAIRANRRQIQITRYELALARELLTKRAVAIYKHEDVTSLDVVFGAQDFGDLVGQMDLMRRVVRSDADLLRSVTRTQKELDARASKLADDMRSAEKLVAQREREYATIRAELGRRRAVLAGVRADISALVREQAKAAAEKSETVRPPAADPGGGAGQWWPLVKVAAEDNGVSARGMYRLMMIESGGCATIVGPGGFRGLFQYAPSTWRGDWNPWRQRSITDGAAQIRATALALRQGRGPAWWGNTYAWAFSGD